MIGRPFRIARTRAVKIVYRLWWRLLRAWAPRKSWNSQFATDYWNLPRSPETTRRVAQFCRAGRLVEFGCAVGALPRVLPAGTFSQYKGYDISDVAIARARERAPANCSFEQVDMANWSGDEDISLIVIEEALYYLSAKQQRRFLHACCRSLAPDGHVLVIVHSAD
jgi:trans-aconitate methyltransferase